MGQLPCANLRAANYLSIGISKLCASSREEDRYGVVQSSEGLQGVLSSLLACALAVEKYSSLPIHLSPSLPHLDAHQLVEPQSHALAAGR